MSKELNKTYDPKDIEDRLYKKWEDNGYFHAEVDRSTSSNSTSHFVIAIG